MTLARTCNLEIRFHHRQNFFHNQRRVRIFFATFGQLRNDRYTYIRSISVDRSTNTRAHVNTLTSTFSNAIERCIQISTMSADIGRAGWLNYDSSRYSIIYYFATYIPRFVLYFSTTSAKFYKRQIKNFRHRNKYSRIAPEISCNQKKKFDERTKFHEQIYLINYKSSDYLIRDKNVKLREKRILRVH